MVAGDWIQVLSTYSKMQLLFLILFASDTASAVKDQSIASNELWKILLS